MIIFSGEVMITTGTFISHSPAPHVCEEKGKGCPGVAHEGTGPGESQRTTLEEGEVGAQW